MKSRDGFGAFEVVAVLAMVTLVGFLGYIAYMRYEGPLAKTEPSTATTTVATPSKVDDISVESAPVINETADLGKADETLDSINIDSEQDDGDLAKLEKDMN